MSRLFKDVRKWWKFKISYRNECPRNDLSDKDVDKYFANKSKLFGTENNPR